MYENIAKQLRESCHDCKLWDGYECCLRGDCTGQVRLQAADAFEELLKVAKAMHTWIFLHSADEQAAYDECGLTGEMNIALGYSGQFVVKSQKEES